MCEAGLLEPDLRSESGNLCFGALTSAAIQQQLLGLGEAAQHVDAVQPRKRDGVILQPQRAQRGQAYRHPTHLFTPRVCMT